MPNSTKRPGGACTGGRKLADKERKRTAPDWPGKGEDPFDLWLRRSLRGAFDSTLEEPVPEEVLRLIEEDRSERERLRRRRAAERGG
jgi:hypothetical protein